ncbi:hypothetical protein H0X06_05725 [Candidatus Dependentiae bacterium]|nr:hypothetical protein [Candidatus Dependentiae bacterium]
MKRYVVAGLLCVSFVFGSLNCVNVIEGELLTAIRDNDGEKVQLLLLETPTLERGTKARLLAATSTSVEEWQKSVSLFGTVRDSLAMISGGAIALWGLTKIYNAYSLISELSTEKHKTLDLNSGANPALIIKNKSMKRRLWELGIETPLLAGLGYHMVKRGYNCVSALKSLKEAKRIQCLIENAPYAILPLTDLRQAKSILRDLAE